MGRRGWRRSREPQSYLRRVSGEYPASVRRVSHDSPGAQLGRRMLFHRKQRRTQFQVMPTGFRGEHHRATLAKVGYMLYAQQCKSDTHSPLQISSPNPTIANTTATRRRVLPAGVHWRCALTKSLPAAKAKMIARNRKKTLTASEILMFSKSPERACRESPTDGSRELAP